MPTLKAESWGKRMPTLKAARGRLGEEEQKRIRAIG